MKYILYTTNMRENDSRVHKKAEQINVYKRLFRIKENCNLEIKTHYQYR